MCWKILPHPNMMVAFVKVGHENILSPSFHKVQNKTVRTARATEKFQPQRCDGGIITALHCRPPLFAFIVKVPIQVRGAGSAPNTYC